MTNLICTHRSSALQSQDPIHGALTATFHFPASDYLAYFIQFYIICFHFYKILNGYPPNTQTTINQNNTIVLCLKINIYSFRMFLIQQRMAKFPAETRRFPNWNVFLQTE